MTLAATPVEGISLNAVASNGTFTGSAIGTASTTAFSNESMIVSMANYAGYGTVTVGLEVSMDGTNWATVGVVEFPAAREVAGTVPGCQLRGVIYSWPATVTAGTVTAAVEGAGG